jgi:hypothetical protein
VSRRAETAMMDFHLKALTLEKPIEASKLVWDKAP